MYKVFEFEVYQKDEPGFRRALVVAKNQDEAEDKFCNSDIDFYDYRCNGYKQYVGVII